MGFSGTANANTELGFSMPPEEAPHQATFMQWPVSRLVYDDPIFLEMVQNTIADIANTISDFESVWTVRTLSS